MKTNCRKKTGYPIRAEEWDRLEYLRSSSGKSLSRYVEDKVLNYIKENPDKKPRELKRNKEGAVKNKSFCFSSEEVYKLIKSQAKKCNMFIYEYILAICL